MGFFQYQWNSYWFRKALDNFIEEFYDEVVVSLRKSTPLFGAAAVGLG